MAYQESSEANEAGCVGIMLRHRQGVSRHMAPQGIVKRGAGLG